MNEIKLLFDKFELFLKRSILPSTSFLILLLLFDILLDNRVFLKFLEKDHHTIMILVIISIFIGFSNFLTIVNQYIFDNHIKGNYDNTYCCIDDNIELVSLREKVINTLPTSSYSDYLLYQIIGKKMKELNKPIKTHRYVDEAKSIGIFFVSLLIMTFILAIKIVVIHKFLWWVVLIVTILTPLLLFLFYILGKELIKSRYKSRAIRIYTNYLDEVQ